MSTEDGTNETQRREGPTADEETTPGKSRTDKKWGKEIMSCGFTILPNVLLDRQRALGLDSTDLVLLLHLLKFWWTKDDLPHPGVTTISKLMEVDRRTIQRRLRKLTDTLRLVTKEERRTRFGDSDTNIYSFDGLITEATKLAKAMLKERDEQQAEKLKRATRGRRRTP